MPKQTSYNGDPSDTLPPNEIDRVRTIVASTTLLCLCTLASADTANWPEFRGPLGNGQAPDAKLPESLDPSKVKWTTPIHGKGWSSPVVWGDQIWLTTATEDGTKMSVICVDRKSGDIVHDIVAKENERACVLPSDEQLRNAHAGHRSRTRVRPLRQLPDGMLRHDDRGIHLAARRSGVRSPPRTGVVTDSV